MEIDVADKYRESVIALLAAEKLPVTDLPSDLDNFIVARQGHDLLGVAGLEVYGKYGLLRSLAVRQDSRNNGIAGELLQRIVALSSLKGLTELYLLTETAPEYFSRKGFDKIVREEVPNEVKQSSEFSHVCPQSAIVMKKPLIS